MKSQKSIIESNWEGGKPFLSRTKNEDVSIDENYYVGREYLFDPKAKKPNNGSFFTGKKKSLVLWAASIFAVVSFFYDGGTGGAIGISTGMFIVMMFVMKIGDSNTRSNKGYSSVSDGEDLVARNTSIYPVDKIFHNKDNF
jgi:hypothetical protein